jgi:hypothetical protein
MSKAAYQSLVIRSQALDEKYRLGSWKNVPQGMSLGAYRSLAIRSAALDKKYAAPQRALAAVRAPVSAGGFSWSAFGIGAFAMLGLVLLATGAVVASRANRETPRVRTS